MVPLPDRTPLDQAPHDDATRDYLHRTYASELASVLRDTGPAADVRWRRLFAGVTAVQGPDPVLLRLTWHAILDFDPVLRAHLEDPVDAGGAVLVAGSGKESFKTFNVTTAAAILAAGAGARVVKGVSGSVSAVSGSADVLAHLGVATTPHPDEIGVVLDRHGIAFVPYRLFCPRYGSRYDGVFADLTPPSFFMPISVLAVRAHAYVFGLAHRRVDLAVSALGSTRPDIRHGLVVATEPVPGRVIDEYVPHGQAHLGHLREDGLQVLHRRHRRAGRRWRSEVGHRPSHCGNAALVDAAVHAGPATAVHALVEHNAALILDAHHGFALGEAQALVQVRAARADGRAAAVLSALQTAAPLAVTR